MAGDSPRNARGTRFHLGEGITGEVAARGQTIYVEDIANEDDRAQFLTRVAHVLARCGDARAFALAERLYDDERDRCLISICAALIERGDFGRALVPADEQSTVYALSLTSLADHPLRPGVRRTFRLAVPDGRVVASEQECVDAVEQLHGRVALKLASPRLLHKSDAGALRLDLGTDEARAAYLRGGWDGGWFMPYMFGALAVARVDVAQSVTVNALEINSGARLNQTPQQVANGAFAYGYAVGLEFNALADRSAPQVYRVKVLSKEVSESSHVKSWDLTLEPYATLAKAAQHDAGIVVDKGGTASAWNHNVVLGMVNVSGEHDPNQMCNGAGWAWIHESHTIGHDILSLLTAGLWEPSSIEVQCAAKPR